MPQVGVRIVNTEAIPIAMISPKTGVMVSNPTDSGIGFYTPASGGTLTFRGGFSNIGHFGWHKK